MAEWSELDDAEQRFTIAHLLYLNLRAQAAQLRALRQLRDLVGHAVDDLDRGGEEPEDDVVDKVAATADPEPVIETPAEPALDVA